MARKYEYSPGCYAWNPEQCEEVIFITGLGEVSGFIPPDQEWRWTLEYYFFNRGEGLDFGLVDKVNAVRKRRGLDPIEIRETEIGHYVRCEDKPTKSQRRHQIREELTNASDEIIAERRNRARADEKLLQPPHYTFDEWQAQRQNTGVPFILKRTACRGTEPNQPIQTEPAASVETLAKALELRARRFALRSSLWCLPRRLSKWQNGSRTQSCATR
jgi:hypothetical protein